MPPQEVSPPRILLSALWDEKLKSFWMLPAYTELLLKLGAAPFILPLGCSEDVLQALTEDADGILLCGGNDLDPALYGEKPHPGLGPLCPERDLQEGLLFQEALKKQIPLFGICRGF